jgi:DNA-binding GntR family transcriptional regulator
LYKTLEKVYRFSIRDADEVIDAGNVDEEEAQYLEIKTNTPVLVVNRITYLDNDRVIEKLNTIST